MIEKFISKVDFCNFYLLEIDFKSKPDEKLIQQLMQVKERLGMSDHELIRAIKMTYAN